MNINKAAEALWNLHAQERSWDELSEIEQGQMRSEAAFVVEAALDDTEQVTRERVATVLRHHVLDLGRSTCRCGWRPTGPTGRWFTEHAYHVTDVLVAEGLSGTHHHEAWQIRDSAKGGRYCAACGQGVS